MRKREGEEKGKKEEKKLNTIEFTKKHPNM